MASVPGGSPGRDASYLRLIALGAAIGLPAALLAALFLALVHQCEDWLWTDLPDWLGQDSPPWYLVVGLPIAGAALVWVARRYLPGDGGHEPVKGISATPTPWRYAPGVALAALGTLAFGAVLGPEGPLIALGSAVGMVVVAVARPDARGTAVLATAGSFSAISALFGGPLVAGIMLMEAGVGLGAALTPALLPGLVAAAIGYVLFVGFGSGGGLDVAGLAVPGLPSYEGTRIVDLVLAVAVGVLAAVVIFAVRKLATILQSVSVRRMALVLFAGAAAVGLIAEAGRLLGANSQDILFSGQASVPAIVAEASPRIVLITLVAKALGYGISLGCGFRGGPVFPAIFLGVAIATFGVIWFDASPTWAVAIGAAAGMTAGTSFVITSLLFAALLVGVNGIDTLPAAVLASVAAWLTTKFLAPATPVPEETPGADT
jgi:H+/Cl- antiporter ClcA